MKYGVSFIESILKIIDQICNCNVCNVLQKNVNGFGLKIWPSYRRAHSSPPILMLTPKEIIGPNGTKRSALGFKSKLIYTGLYGT